MSENTAVKCSNCGMRFSAELRYCPFCGAAREALPEPFDPFSDSGDPLFDAQPFDPFSDRSVPLFDPQPGMVPIFDPPPDDEDRCSVCGHLFEDGERFCPVCGELRDERAKNEPEPIDPEDDKDRCGNCSKRLSPGDKYCSYCGTKRGEGAFEPRDNLMVSIYGPPVTFLHTCEACGHSWEVFALGDDQTKYCPQCGSPDLNSKRKPGPFRPWQ